MDEGILYYAVGEEYLEQAETSAWSVKENMQDIHVTVFTDQETDSEVFDRIEEAEAGKFPFLNRISVLRSSPYDRTLYLDTDTYVTDDLSDLFALLDRFELAVAHTEMRHRADSRYSEDVRGDVPVAFPEFNCGVILYRDTERVQDLFDSWEERYSEHLERHGETVNDQPFFSEVLYRSDVRFATLTTEYNCNYPNLGYVQGKVRILHGQAPGKGFEVPPEEMPPVINRDIEKRIYAGKGFRRVMAYPSPLSKWKYPGPSRWRYRLWRARRNVEDEGWLKTIQKILKRSKRLI